MVGGGDVQIWIWGHNNLYNNYNNFSVIAFKLNFKHDCHKTLITSKFELNR